jgi:hypothetical protein
MKANEVKVGGVYVAKVAGKLTEVKVTCIRENAFGQRMLHDVVNLRTGRKTTFRSAAKFRREVPPPAGDEYKKRKGTASEAKVQRIVNKAKEARDMEKVLSILKDGNTDADDAKTGEQSDGGVCVRAGG